MRRDTDRGCIFGVALHGPAELALLVSVDADGVLWCFGEDTRKRLVADCLSRPWRVYASIGHLVYALQLCLCFGVSPQLLARVAARALEPSYDGGPVLVQPCGGCGDGRKRGHQP